MGCLFRAARPDGRFERSAVSRSVVIQAIVGMARGMGKQTIAVFVGDDDTVQLVTRLGVDHGQGYHLGIPAPLGN